MSQYFITKLTSEQEQLISVTKQKFLKIINQPLQEKKVKEILVEIYRYWGYEIPNIIIVNSPKKADHIISQKNKQKEVLGLQFHQLIDEQLQQRLEEQAKNQLELLVIVHG